MKATHRDQLDLLDQFLHATLLVKCLLRKLHQAPLHRECGVPNEYDDLYLFEHLGFWPRIGPNNYDASLLRTRPTPRTTTLHYKFPPQASYSPNTHQSWTACAITKKSPHNGPLETNHNVPAPYFADLPSLLSRMTNTSSWMGTNYTLTTAHSLPSPQDPSKTRSFHLPKKFTKPYFQHFRHGPRAIPYLPSREIQSKRCGYQPYANTILPSRITSLTETSLASNNNSLKRFFTMKTNELLHCVCIAQLFTIDACQQHSPTPWSSSSWKTARSSSLQTPSPTSNSNLGNSILGH